MNSSVRTHPHPRMHRLLKCRLISRDGRVSFCAVMLNDRNLLLNKFVSAPRDLSHVNCGAFAAGIIEGILCSAEFVSGRPLSPWQQREQSLAEAGPSRFQKRCDVSVGFVCFGGSAGSRVCAHGGRKPRCQLHYLPNHISARSAGETKTALKQSCSCVKQHPFPTRRRCPDRRSESREPFGRLPAQESRECFTWSRTHFFDAEVWSLLADCFVCRWNLHAFCRVH